MSQYGDDNDDGDDGDYDDSSEDDSPLDRPTQAPSTTSPVAPVPDDDSTALRSTREHPPRGYPGGSWIPFQNHPSPPPEVRLGLGISPRTDTPPPQQVTSIVIEELQGVDWDMLAAGCTALWEGLGGGREAPRHFVPVPDERRVAILPAFPDPGGHGDEELEESAAQPAMMSSSEAAQPGEFEESA